MAASPYEFAADPPDGTDVIGRGWRTYRRAMNLPWPDRRRTGRLVRALYAELRWHATADVARRIDELTRVLPAAGEDAPRMCRAHPDDCPNGPEPHACYNPQGPVETWTHCCCCVQPEER